MDIFLSLFMMLVALSRAPPNYTPTLRHAWAKGSIHSKRWETTGERELRYGRAVVSNP